MPGSEPSAGEPSGVRSLWVLGILLAVRLIIAPWGDVLIFNDTLDYMRQAKLPTPEVIMGPFPDIEWPRPGSYPLLLKLLGTSSPDDLTTRKAILVFNVLLSTATVGLVALAGRRVFASEPARAGWALLAFALSLTEFVYPQTPSCSECPFSPPGSSASRYSCWGGWTSTCASGCLWCCS